MSNSLQEAAQNSLPSTLVSHFTPSLMAAATLEAILVEREDLASELVEEVLGSTTNPTKAQTLLVGPRGIGKTHLVTLVYHRVRAAKPENLCIAWLREEEYGVVSWLDLLLRIFRALEEEYPGTTPSAELETLFGFPTVTAEREAQTLLRNYLAGRTLWLLVENIDAIFSDIKEAGQRKWRSWLQEHPVVTTLATTPGLFSGISGRNAPFYAFFRIEHLPPLDVEGAVLLLQKLAQVRGDEELASFIETPTGHARVRAVHHLAGGNFRIYVVFASFLKRASLDELVEPFLQLLDELTPYYQSHLAALSAQQRKIIEVLCDHRAPMPVKLLASRGFMTPQTASSQLVELRNRGYVTPQTRGRESLYELREPLLRLCLEVKKQRGEPVALLIEFLRLWYRREELSHRLESCAPEAVYERAYLGRALAEKDKETEDPIVMACVRDLDEADEIADFEKAQVIAKELVAIRGTTFDWENYGYCLFMNGRFDEAIEALDKALEKKPDYVALWAARAATLLQLMKCEEALENVERASKTDPSPQTLHIRGLVLERIGHFAEALRSFNRSLKEEFNPVVLFEKGKVQIELKDFKSSLKTFNSLDKKNFDPLVLWPEMVLLFAVMGDHKKAIEYGKKLLILSPSPDTYRLLSYSSLKDGQFDLALESANHAIVLGDDTPDVLFYKGEALLGLGHEEGFDVLRGSIAGFAEDSGLLSWHLISLFETLFLVFEQNPDASSWAPRWARLASVFESEKALPLLSTALTNFATVLIKSVAAEREADTSTPTKDEVRSLAHRALEWSRSWLDLFDSTAPSQYAALRFAARLSAAAIQVAVTGDDRSLLDFPSEERAIVREILDQSTAANCSKD